jgi:hypothetical protein
LGFAALFLARGFFGAFDLPVSGLLLALGLTLDGGFDLAFGFTFAFAFDAWPRAPFWELAVSAGLGFAGFGLGAGADDGFGADAAAGAGSARRIGWVTDSGARP